MTSETDIEARKTFSGVTIGEIGDAAQALRTFYGLSGERNLAEAVWRPFEELFPVVIAHHDPSLYEAVVPLLLLEPYSPEKMAQACRPALYARLRAAAGVTQYLLDFTRIEIPDHCEVAWRAEVLEDLLEKHNFAPPDPWVDTAPIMDEAPRGYYTHFWQKYGLRTVWPLTDFVKSSKWAIFWHDFFNKNHRPTAPPRDTESAACAT